MTNDYKMASRSGLTELPETIPFTNPNGRAVDITGQRFGWLVAIGTIKRRGLHRKWLCLCDCGKLYDNSNQLPHVGTFPELWLRSKIRKTETRAYRTWARMKSRCNNRNVKDFKNYGGRGIQICQSWNESFENFYADMGDPPSPEHSLDRIDVNGNYEPGNCRWATFLEQANNKRDSYLITINGRTQSLPDWCRELGLRKGTVGSRIWDYGWDPVKAVTTPIRRRMPSNATR
jgi:hypothetical protein